MEIKLSVYDKKEVVKTYTADTYDVMFGTVEDLFDLIDFDNMQKFSDTELVFAVVKAIPKTFGLIKPLLKDIFDGLTDDEIKHCKIKDIAKVLVEVVKTSMADITAGNSKN